MEVININKEKKKAKRRYALHLIFVIVLTLLTIATAVLLLLLSPHKYVAMMIIDIVMCVIVSLFLIFYFINIFPLIRYYYTFFKGMNNVSLERARYLTFIEEKERKDIGNVSHRCLEFFYVEGNKKYRENIYVLDNDDLSFKEDETIKVITYHNVLIKYEVIDHAMD